jgi:hypothetical protein
MRVLLLVGLLTLSGCVGYITADANGQPHVGMLSLLPVPAPAPTVYQTEAPIVR